jgi:diguanylate cyclase (GGDEF)-like protein
VADSQRYSGSAEGHWDALLHVTRSWRLEWNIDQLLERIAREAVELLKLDRSALFLLDRSGLHLRAMWPEAAANGPTSEIEAIAQKVIQSGRPIFAHGLHAFEGASRDTVVLCVPLTASRGVLGAMYVDSAGSAGRSRKDQELLEMLGLQAAAALEHAILYQSAITDPLTGLFSHRHFQQEMEQAVRRGRRSGQPMSMILMDLDHFKTLNDTCGHEAGNKCLVEVAEILRNTLRTTDVLARFGGDEFELLLPDTPIEDAEMVAEKLRPKIAAIPLPKSITVTATIGVAAFPLNAADPQALFLRADAALYEAKAAGRNRTVRSTFKEVQAATPVPANASGLLEMTRGSSNASGRLKPIVDDVDRHRPVIEKIDGHPVEARLGAGSSGEVLLVRQIELDRQVALKRLLTANLTPAQAESFEREAKVTASLCHPGVVTVHTMGRDVDGRRYYTMVPLAGSSLADILKKRRTDDAETLRQYSPGKLIEIIQRASETVAYAHSQNVVHLDLTPSNLIVGSFGQVTIIDWGRGSSSQIARAQPAVTPGESKSLSYVVGSPVYLSPEHLPGSIEQPGAAADVFALGAMLYECLTGQAPFARSTTRETLEALKLGLVVSPENAAPDSGIDPSLSELCLQSLNSNPEQRPTALEFTERLGRFVRREMDWVVTRFGKDHPLVAEEWESSEDGWKLNDGVWEFDATVVLEDMVLWKVPVAGSFRIVCEVCSIGVGELALLGRVAPNSHSINLNRRLEGSGYNFQFGAEYNSSTKFSRCCKNIMIIPGLTYVPGKKHRMELEYNDEEGWVYCYIDGRRIFSYREIFPFAGDRIGFYSFGAGARIRPLEVHRQMWGLRVPAMRLADNLMRHEKYADAIDSYQEIAQRLPNRLEGQEARLKIAICHARSGRFDQAREIFASLRGSGMEPQALAEQGVLEVEYAESGGNYVRGIEVLEELLERFLQSSARSRVHEAADRIAGLAVRLHSNGVENLTARARICKLGRRTCVPPAYTQIRAHCEAVRFQLMLGEWEQAFQESNGIF